MSANPEMSKMQLEKTYRVKPKGPMGCIGWKASLKELPTPDFWRDVFAEFFNTFLFLFLATATSTPYHANNLGMQIGLTNGLMVVALIEAFAHIQGAHFNPVVTLLFLCTKRVSFIKGIFYVIAQCAGAVAASCLVYYCAEPSIQAKMGPVSLGSGVTPLKGVAIEWGITLSFTTVLMGALDENNRKINLPGLPIGVSVGAGIMAGSGYTGGCMNPVIWLGPAVATRKFDNWWVYWLGPALGSLSAVILYSFLVYRGKPFSPRDTIVTELTYPDQKAEALVAEQKKDSDTHF